MKSLSGKVTVVTGASRGVGKGIALGLGEAGATVYITGRTTKNKTDAGKLGGTVFSTAEEVTAIVRDQMEHAWTLDVPLTVDVGMGLNWKDAKS